MWFFTLVLAFGTAVNAPTATVMLSAASWAECQEMQQTLTVLSPARVVSMGKCTNGPRYQ